jgi:hypothetical protein
MVAAAVRAAVGLDTVMYFVARQEANALDTRVVPIILVPGIMGSRLDLDPVDKAPSQWDPDSSITMAR